MADFTIKARRAWRRPLPALIIANIAVFIILGLALLIGKLSGKPASWPVDAFSLPSVPALALRKPWTFATYMFTHYDFLHLLFNMLWLWWFGRMLLLSYPARTLRGLYTAGGILGAVFYLVGMNVIPAFHSSASAMLCGASASVMAIMAFTAFKMPNFPVRLLFLGEIRLKWIALASAVLVFLGLGGGNAGGEMAHIGGLSAGIAGAIIPWHKWRRLPDRIRINRAKRIMQRRQNDLYRLDALLDKIRTSGYQSLSRSEQNELKTLSGRLNKQL